MRKMALLIVLMLMASTIIAAAPNGAMSSKGIPQVDSTHLILAKKPGMCYDPVFKVYYPCIGRGLKNKYPWLNDEQLQKKVDQKLDKAFAWDSTVCKRVWGWGPNNYVVYVCAWENQLSAGYKFGYQY
jgi:hypothetical protein